MGIDGPVVGELELAPAVPRSIDIEQMFDHHAWMRWETVDEQSVRGRHPDALFDADSLSERHVGRGEFRGMEFLHVNARRIISTVPAGSRMPFRHTINVYRGCSHACTYCFARPTHEYLGLGIGEDFERRIVVKVNAVERLRAELAARRWAGHLIAMGTNTDPYQRCEGKYHLTQGVVRVLGEAANPFSILTKSTLVLRDLDLLLVAAHCTEVRVTLSVGTLDEDVWRLSEPGTPRPTARLEAVRRLNEAGIKCGVLVAPILPGLSDRDDQLRAIAEACVAVGATSVAGGVLHLRPGVKEHYLAWLESVRPELARHTADRFGSQSYLPKAAQKEITDRLQAHVVAARREAHPASGQRTPPAGRRAGRTVPSVPPASAELQLRLLPPPGDTARTTGPPIPAAPDQPMAAS